MKVVDSNKEMTIEVLISTMNQTSFSFLKEMFAHHELEKCQILVINQTEQGNELKSEQKNIRVINSYETGLSKSRNLAIKNAIGDICLIADDDVKYVHDFQQIIKNAFIQHVNASIIKFKIETFIGAIYKPYPENSKKISRKKEIRPSSSVEIAFKRKDIVNSNIQFNTNFGLGSYFPSGEEYLFLKDVLDRGMSIYFENKTIVKHSLERSTSNLGSDDFVRTQAAIYYNDYKQFGYLFLLKYIFFLLRKKIISTNLAIVKFKTGLEGIAMLKKLNK